MLGRSRQVTWNDVSIKLLGLARGDTFKYGTLSAEVVDIDYKLSGKDVNLILTFKLPGGSRKHVHFRQNIEEIEVVENKATGKEKAKISATKVKNLFGQELYLVCFFLRDGQNFQPYFPRTRLKIGEYSHDFKIG